MSATVAALRIGSVFSGVGGLDLGVLAATGGAVAWHCEREPYPRAVLADRFPGVPCFDDVRALTAGDAPAIDMLIGGPPCQPTSNAGKRKGVSDDRWLWPEFLRLVREMGPRLVFVENPAAILTLDGGRPFRGILGALSESGFDAEWMCLRASDVGAPHRRERLFLLAWQADGACSVADALRGRDERCGVVGVVGVAASRDRRERQARNHERDGDAAVDRGSVLADADGGGLGGLGGSGLREDQRKRQAQAHRNDADRCDCARDVGDATGARREGPRADAHEGGSRPLHGHGRTPEPGVGGGAHGAAAALDAHRWPAPPGPQHEWEPSRTVTETTPHRRPRLKALGNAVVPQQAARALRALLVRAGLSTIARAA